MNIDLHTHSNVSDGVLKPREVVQLAGQNGVQALALTDHDDVAGLDEAHSAARELGITFIPGVEISATWEDVALHIVGLNFDPSDAGLRAGLSSVRAGRFARAEAIAAQFDALGIRGSLDGALARADNKALIGRTHFARFLVDEGHVKDVKSVFRTYLVAGKPGYVAHQWASLADALDWIRASGGTAVLAHPGRYPLAAPAMRRLLADFKRLGGGGIEVVTSTHSADQRDRFAGYARQFGLRASRGSDFHAPEESRALPGNIADLPPSCEPVWAHWPVLQAA